MEKRNFSVKKDILSNGLRLVFIDCFEARSFSLHAFVNVGSANDPKNMKGLAHVLEHVITTSSMNGKVRLLGQGGLTCLDYTHYIFQITPSSFDEFARCLRHSLFLFQARRLPETLVAMQVRSVRKEIQREWRYPKAGKLYAILYRTAFKKHSYRWSPVGCSIHVRKIRSRHCVDMGAKYYVPNGMVLVFTGRFSESRYLQQVQEHFRDLRQSRNLEERVNVREPIQSRERVKIVTGPEPFNRLLCGFKTPAFNPVIWARHFLLQNLMLFTDLGGQRHLAQGMRDIFWVFPVTRGTGLFEVYAEFGGPVTHAQEIFRRSFSQLSDRRFVATNFKAALARAQASLRRDFKDTYRVGHAVGLFELFCGDFRQWLSMPKILSEVGESDILEAAENIFQTSQMTTVIGLGRN